MLSMFSAALDRGIVCCYALPGVAVRDRSARIDNAIELTSDNFFKGNRQKVLIWNLARKCSNQPRLILLTEADYLCRLLYSIKKDTCTFRGS
jgi:hypothetical protein